MKIITKLTGLILLYSATVGADVFFLPNNPMPLALQKKIEAVMHERCEAAFDLSLSAFEKSTTVRKEKVDQGVIDYFFTSQFEITQQNDPYHFDTYIITVESAQYAGSNPSPDVYGEVISIQAEENLCQ